MARSVTIYRDTYGVPHVFGRTDASVVFGLAYAQAEDNFAHLEDNFIRSLGRGAEVHGEEALAEARLAHVLEVPRLSREEYERAAPRMRTMASRTPGNRPSRASISPGSMRKPRILTCWSARETKVTSPSRRYRPRSPVR